MPRQSNRVDVFGTLKIHAGQMEMERPSTEHGRREQPDQPANFRGHAPTEMDLRQRAHKEP